MNFGIYNPMFCLHEKCQSGILVRIPQIILDFTVFREGTLLSGARILIKIKKSFVFYEF
jgi:hypothetical protein